MENALRDLNNTYLSILIFAVLILVLMENALRAHHFDYRGLIEKS